MNNQIVTVNLVPGLSTPAVIRVSQYDVGRPLTIRVFDGTGAASFGASVTATIVGTKPSGLGFTETGTIAGNTVTLNTTLAMTQERGMIPAEIRFTQTGEDIGTANFILAVEPSPHPDGTTDGTQETMANLETRLQGQINSMTLGIDESDDLLYLYVNGVRQGEGIEIGGEPASYGNIVLSKNTMTILEEESDTLTVVLASAPSANQTVYLAVSDDTKISVSPNMLSFTSTNWDTPQTVTVTALPDADSGDESEAVVFSSRSVESKTLTVTITDTTPEKVTSGLQLEFDFRNLDSEATTVIDTINGVTLQNLDTAYFNKVANGIYGSSNYRYATVDTAATEFTTFKSEMAGAALNGYTFEIFGLRMPDITRGTYGFIATKAANGYSASPNATSGPGISPGKTPYIDTNDSAQDISTWTGSNSVFDNGTANGYVTTDQQSFLQADIVYNNDGTVDCYYNGYKNRTTWTGTVDFKSWDIEKHLNAMGSNFLGAIFLGTSSDYYLTFMRIYSKPLSSSEVAQNISYNKQVLGISNF